MPQQSLLPDQPPMTALVVELHSRPVTNGESHVDILVRVGVGQQPVKTRWAGALEGLECDLLDTFLTEVGSAYMYGEVTKDVVRAAAAVKHQARTHRIQHGF